MSNQTLDAIVAIFGDSAKKKLNSASISGAPEDQLRAPLENLITSIASLSGLPDGAVVPIGETSLSDIKVRPDYAVTVHGALTGFIEVKAPGKGADPRKFKDAHDKEQWDKLKSLPNLIYTDGNAFSLWRDGSLYQEIVKLDGDIETSGTALKAPPSLQSLFSSFFQWNPIPPKNAKQLAQVAARLCRLLRDEVSEQMDRKSALLTNLAEDWRRYLFPSANNEEFADGYAQAVTFGLLMARAKDISLGEDLAKAARQLKTSNSLIGTALDLFTNDPTGEDTLKTSLQTLVRVLDVVHWEAISKGQPDAWLYFYEDFLDVYDHALRKKTGSYYTPVEVVDQMIRLVDDVLRSNDRFALPAGLASQDVTIADPAVGTGTFLLGIIKRIAESVQFDQGEGAVAGAVQAAIPRLIGFERQFGPFAVAQLRLMAEILSLSDKDNLASPLRLFFTNTLANPYAEEEHIPTILLPLGESRKQANEIKKREAITVVIGNPPYKDKAGGLGGWIEEGSVNRAAPMKSWSPPTNWGVGTHAKHLKNLYVYFWRWATWKVFGDAELPEEDQKTVDRKGIICFITVAGFLNGPGFQKMRADLRRDADEIWVIDCTPEGHQPPVASRIFQGVQQPVCIVMAARKSDAGSTENAVVRYRSLKPSSQNEKFTELASIELEGNNWDICPSSARAPFLPARSGDWGNFVGIEELFSISSSGVMPGRTWVIAPDQQSLEQRWSALINEEDQTKKETLFHPTLRKGAPADRHSRKIVKSGLHGHEHRSISVSDDTDALVKPVRYAFRSFDRQWLIPDNRLLLSARPNLWSAYSKAQFFITLLNRSSPTRGPALTFCAFMPDYDHYKGSFSGRAFPLWLDESATQSNIKPALLSKLSEILGLKVTAEDALAYIAAVAAHPEYTFRFQEDLVQPGLRIPITADAGLFSEATELGREVIWLHTFGERFVDTAAGRPFGPPKLPADERPTIPKNGTIPSEPDRMPDEISHNAAHNRLQVGKGYIENVSKAVWDYEVSGMQVLTQWFSYRKKDRSRPTIGDKRPPSPLCDIQPEGWLAEYTTELLNVLNVLGRLVALEPKQADLLDRIVSSDLILEESLRSAGVLDAPKIAGAKKKDERQGELL